MDLNSGLLAIRTPGVCFHVLRDAKGLYLLDCGFWGSRRYLAQALQKRGWEHERILGIILTHGHLDHILHAAEISAASGAWIAAPRLDAAHYAGHASYSCLARVTGMLESIGRKLLGFQSFTPDRLLDDGDVLDVWYGLRAVSLPGHTPGHMGFYCESLRLLFSADLFASYSMGAVLPPAFFNSEPARIPGSIAKAVNLNLQGVLPNHGDAALPAIHLQRLKTLAGRCPKI